MIEKLWSSALRDCLALIAAPVAECVSRREALGRLLVEAVCADRDYPIGNLSTMDGYAVAAVTGGTLTVVGENTPGSGPGAPLEAGGARRIFTGAELPEGATCVVQQELTSRDGDVLTVHAWPKGSNVRCAGTECLRGDVVLAAGTRIGPVERAVLSTVGRSGILVEKRPRIAHISTGDELAAPDDPAPGFRIRDSNSDLVAAFLSGAGYALLDQRHVGDDRGALHSTVDALLQECDVLLVSGGASVGDHDHTRSVLDALGFHFVVQGLRLRPGKPTGIALRDGKWTFALAGNPVSHLVALCLFVLPLLRAFEGEGDVAPAFVEGSLVGDLALAVPQRPTFWPAVAALRDGRYQVKPLRFLSSGDLIGVAGANALLFLEEGAPVPLDRASVLFLPLHA